MGMLPISGRKNSPKLRGKDGRGAREYLESYIMDDMGKYMILTQRSINPNVKLWLTIGNERSELIYTNTG